MSIKNGHPVHPAGSVNGDNVIKEQIKKATIDQIIDLLLWLNKKIVISLKTIIKPIIP